jgi:hypothetical protein
MSEPRSDFLEEAGVPPFKLKTLEDNAYESNMVHFVARDFAELRGLVFARTS